MKYIIFSSIIITLTWSLAEAQEVKLGQKADVEFFLMNQNVGNGTKIQNTIKQPSLTTKDFVSVQIYKNPKSPYPEYAYNLLFRLTPEGTRKLNKLCHEYPGRYLVLMSHGQNFNSHPLGEKFSGKWLLWMAPLRKAIAERWLKHITCEKLLPDPFKN